MSLPKPVVIGDVEKGKVCYVSHETLGEWYPHEEQCQVCLVDAEPIAAWTPDTVVKVRHPFWNHQNDERLTYLLTECADNKVYHPGSYAGIFRALYQSPRAYKGFNSWLREGFAGGWEESFEEGRVKGPLYVYDINSAYLWAALQWLPDPKSFRITDRIPDKHGLALVRAVSVADRVPPPWKSGERAIGIVLPGDVDRYELKHVECWFAVEWDASAEVVDGICATLDKVPCARDVMKKVFWGSWAPRAADIQTAHMTKGRTLRQWPMPPMYENVIFAALITGRVKQQTWEVAKLSSTVECFVDSALTSQILPTGEDPGQWRLVESYPKGVYLHGPRAWQTPDGRWCRCSGHAGAKVGSKATFTPREGENP